MTPSLTSGEKSLAADALVAAIKAEVSHVGGTQSEFSVGLLMREQLVRRGRGGGGEGQQEASAQGASSV